MAPACAPTRRTWRVAKAVKFALLRPAHLNGALSPSNGFVTCTGGQLPRALDTGEPGVGRGLSLLGLWVPPALFLASWLAAGNPGSWQGLRLGMADRVDDDGVFCFADWLFRKPLGRRLSKLFPVLEVSALRSVPL